jgi:hypothetical protein
MILESKILDQLYIKWKIDRQGSDYEPHSWDYKRTYQRTYRGGYEEQRFENWLFGQGFTVIQREGKRYLKFSGDERRLTLFLLKHNTMTY